MVHNANSNFVNSGKFVDSGNFGNTGDFGNFVNYGDFVNSGNFGNSSKQIIQRMTKRDKSLCEHYLMVKHCTVNIAQIRRSSFIRQEQSTT